MQRLTATDAQTLWMSASIPNDQFLLYCFAGRGAVDSALTDELLARSARIGELGQVVCEVPGACDHPWWVDRVPQRSQIVVHATDLGWDECLRSVTGMMADQLDARRQVWRLHLFAGVIGTPTVSGAATVAVLQISHAAADGRVSADIARALFGGDLTGVPVTDERLGRWTAAARGLGRMPGQVVRLFAGGRTVARADAHYRDDVAAERIPTPTPGRPRSGFNADPGSVRWAHCIVRDAALLRMGGRHAVTVGALTAVGAALCDIAVEPDTFDWSAEVTVGKPGERSARNHFRNVGIDLHTDVGDADTRAGLIAADLAGARRRGEHPVFARQAAVNRAVPAALLRLGVRQFDPTVVPHTVTGHTVVSSVNRGVADLTLAGAPVAFTAGFPALSPVQSLTHGVHGLGDTVTVSVLGGAAARPVFARYVAALERALDSLV
ncbi:WS/DGAT domain-containing protein [Williamsia sterculiae]|uniref:O-acyltransferase WSD1 C-terminal domain-containing protein n=1 Tax=Williamsia sterculiae TaxID=1344003 RepID=A0A1N7FSC2_9NOCA|nr:WS/DGAT domain-containing protein [Williamsia sterculiae]SIS03272.1 Protein of unknown function [Williamsia sterculiae]